MSLTNRTLVWSREDVPGPEFLRRLTAWFSHEGYAHKVSIHRDSRSGHVVCTMTQVTKSGDRLQRTFTSPFLEVTNAFRTLPGEDPGLPEVGDGDGPEGDHHESCDCHACTQEKLF